jgi:hypothetical protein
MDKLIDVLDDESIDESYQDSDESESIELEIVRQNYLLLLMKMIT